MHDTRGSYRKYTILGQYTTQEEGFSTDSSLEARTSRRSVSRSLRRSASIFSSMPPFWKALDVIVFSNDSTHSMDAQLLANQRTQRDREQKVVAAKTTSNSTYTYSGLVTYSETGRTIMSGGSTSVNVLSMFTALRTNSKMKYGHIGTPRSTALRIQKTTGSVGLKMVETAVLTARQGIADDTRRSSANAMLGSESGAQPLI